MSDNNRLIPNIFIGFASQNPNGQAYDQELVVIDLLNEIKTRQGQRVMNPQFGSIIWDLLFEPKSDFQRAEIERDLVRIIANEPRVELLQIELFEEEHGYIGQCTLRFIELDQVATLTIQFNQQLAENNRSN
jgi:phage baseplate assembly protein W